MYCGEKDPHCENITCEMNKWHWDPREPGYTEKRRKHKAIPINGIWKHVWDEKSCKKEPY